MTQIHYEEKERRKWKKIRKEEEHLFHLVNRARRLHEEIINLMGETPLPDMIIQELTRMINELPNNIEVPILDLSREGMIKLYKTWSRPVANSEIPSLSFDKYSIVLLDTLFPGPSAENMLKQETIYLTRSGRLLPIFLILPDRIQVPQELSIAIITVPEETYQQLRDLVEHLVQKAYTAKTLKDTEMTVRLLQKVMWHVLDNLERYRNLIQLLA